MDPMCYLPVQGIPGNYHEKKQKGTRRKQQPKTPQTKLVGVLSCSMHRSSFKFVKHLGNSGLRENHKSTNHWEIWKASKKNTRRKPPPFSNFTPKSIQSANLEFHQSLNRSTTALQANFNRCFQLFFLLLFLVSLSRFLLLSCKV